MAVARDRTAGQRPEGGGGGGERDGEGPCGGGQGEGDEGGQGRIEGITRGVGIH